MRLIDTHAHIYLPEFDLQRKQLLLDAKESGVDMVVMPAIDSTTHQHMIDVEAQFGNCRAMMGLHPCSVTAGYQAEVATMEAWLDQRAFVAIGEAGLDFHWDKTYISEQYTALHIQAEWAMKLRLPLVLHSRNATDECIDVMKQYPGLRGIFHCFSGTAEQAESIVSMGLMLGIGGVLTFKNGGLDKSIAPIPLEHLVLETDAPYLAPVPFRGKQNVPAHLQLVAEKLALLKGIDLEEVASVTTDNAINLFHLG
jgi:TatD DNase family protein